MNRKRVPVPVIVILVLIVVVGGYFGIRTLLTPAATALTASGTIETVEVIVSPEIGGKVAEVAAQEGDRVKAGDVLFRLDGTLLEAQRAVAAANMDLVTAAAETAKRAQETSEANWTLALDAAQAESAAARTADWRALNPVNYTLTGGYFTLNELQTAARAEVDKARSARDSAQTKLSELLTNPSNASFIASEQRLINARASLLVAQDVLTRANLSTSADLKDSAQAAYDTAKTEVEDAQAAYDVVTDTDLAKTIIAARADLAIAQEVYDAANDRLLALQIGVNSPKVMAAQAAVNQAAEAAQQAQKAVTQAEASLALIDVQIAKLTVTAPADGTILTSSLQPGEVVAPNAAAMTLGRLDTLTITVYVPENLYGQLFLGQSASLTVDSFPGEIFAATVIHIADQAEFTPRNVQTVEGRSSTVFAIKLQILDPNVKLKPGMPADVVFTSNVKR
jgi:HlyD family secretion protein